MRSIVRKRVRDGVLLRLIGKWLKADVMEDGRIEYLEAGIRLAHPFSLWRIPESGSEPFSGANLADLFTCD